MLGWRDVPTDDRRIGPTARASQPTIRQLFIGAGPAHEADQDAFERKLYVIRRVAEKAYEDRMYIASLSSRTLVYKGMLISYQLADFYRDLADERMSSAFVLVHSRFSTNTFPSWELAHPYRMIAHNGEINTLQGNVNWMRARESQMASELFGEDLAKVLPVVRPGGSDSATFDNVLELLTLAGRSLPHAVMMMIPEAYRNRDGELPPELGGFYAFHACFMEPWDGPAAVAFTDGRVIGATLDRNGLRPGRWMETTDGLVILGSEAGLLPIAPSTVKRLGRLQPGKLFLIDLEAGRIVPDAEVKHAVSTRRPYGAWFDEHTVHFDQIPLAEPVALEQPLRSLQLAFGYSREDISVTLPTMVLAAEEPIGSMGSDISLAVLSDATPTLFNYFKQLFAQVTNPPIDPIREDIVMSIGAGLGAEGNLLEESPRHAHQLVLDQPILRNHELETLRTVSHDVFKPLTIDITWPVADGPDGMEAALTRRLRAGARRDRPRREHHHPLRPRGRPGARADPVAARRRRGPPPPRARGHTPAGRPRDRDRRGAPGAPHRDAGRLRRERRQPLGDVRDRRRGGRRRSAGRLERTRARSRRGRDRGPQGDRQGAAEDDLEDGHLDDPVLLRRADLRGGRALALARRSPLHRHRIADRRDRARRARAGGADAPCARVPPRAERSAAGRRRLRVAARRRAPHVEPGHDRAAPARRAQRRRGGLPGVRAGLRRGGHAAGDAARPARGSAATRRRSRSRRSSRGPRSSSAS